MLTRRVRTARAGSFEYYKSSTFGSYIQKRPIVFSTLSSLASNCLRVSISSVYTAVFLEDSTSLSDRDGKFTYMHSISTLISYSVHGHWQLFPVTAGNFVHSYQILVQKSH